MKSLKEISGGFSDFCWSTVQHRETSLISIDQTAKPTLHFIPEIQSVTEHAGIIITNDLVMVGKTTDPLTCPWLADSLTMFLYSGRNGDSETT